MGIVLGVEAAAAIGEAAAAAETAAVPAVEAAEPIASAADAGEVLAKGTEAGIDAGTKAGSDAATAAEAGGGNLSSVLTTALQKVAKMVEEYIIIDQIFKAAKALIEAAASDPAARARAKRLEILVSVLTQSCTIMKNVNDWLQSHSKDKTLLANIQVPVDQGVLAKFLSPLGAAAKTLSVLSKQVGEKNVKKDPITDGEVDALHVGLTSVLQALLDLAKFKVAHQDKVEVLRSLPISTKEVTDLQAKI